VTALVVQNGNADEEGLKEFWNLTKGYCADGSEAHREALSLVVSPPPQNSKIRITHKLRNNISVLEGSGGNIAVLTGPDGQVHIDAGIGVSRPQITKALADLSADHVKHLINTHWHFDQADGNDWLDSVGSLRTTIPASISRRYSASRIGLQFPSPANRWHSHRRYYGGWRRGCGTIGAVRN
jgi:glyoxylase-like metal-dependent hydrolase (beta-lactamase superfamily II)